MFIYFKTATNESEAKELYKALYLSYSYLDSKMQEINKEFRQFLDSLKQPADNQANRKAAILKNDPETFPDAVKHFILRGGKFSQSDFTRYTGFGGTNSPLRHKAKHGFSDYLLAKQRQYINDNGCDFDSFIAEWNGQFYNDIVNEVDAINTICEILDTTREQMINSFFEIPF